MYGKVCSSFVQDPEQAIGQGRENVWYQAEPEGESCVDVDVLLPAHPQPRAVCVLYRGCPICFLEVELGQEGPCPQSPDDGNCAID